MRKNALPVSKLFLFCLLILTCAFALSVEDKGNAYAMPFYGLEPHEIVFRAEYSTDYGGSSAERKHNIALAVKSLDKVLLDASGEFSFNRTVGARTVNRGYKPAKIIVNGAFTEGVGGGVCQVSTTLYNAALLAGLKITESHAHSLSVGYVPLSFDAMVNSGSADLRFINETKNPVIIRAFADGKKLTVKIYGEPMCETYKLKSVVKSETLPRYDLIKDVDGRFPDLYAGETRIISYGKKGYESEGYLLTVSGGKTLSTVRIRRDRYSPVNGVKIEGTAERKEEPAEIIGLR